MMLQRESIGPDESTVIIVYPRRLGEEHGAQDLGHAVEASFLSVGGAAAWVELIEL